MSLGEIAERLDQRFRLLKGATRTAVERHSTLRRVVDWSYDLLSDEERTVLISSHAISDLERFADHVGMIKHGRLVFEGAITDILERYCVVDFTVERPIDLADAPGLIVQTRTPNRWRVLLDRQGTTLEALRARGAQQMAEAPVSLEDLFVALGRDAS